MAFSIQVKTLQDKLVQLSIIDNDLIIDNKNHISLNHIYNVENQPELLRIDTIIQAKLPEQDSTDLSKKTLTNIRPQDLPWTLKSFEYYPIESTNEFVTQLRKLTVPLRSQFSNTKIYCVLNPTSGSRQAESHWKNTVIPILTTAGFNPDNIVKISTECNGKTRNIAKSLGTRILEQQDVFPPIIISMGGDGTLNEVVNGLSDAVDTRTGHFRLAVIPAGSGNAFALGLGIESIEQATLKIIQAKQEQPFYYMDIQFVQPSTSPDWHDNLEYDTLKLPIRLCVVASWGFHAQIVSKSRYLRYFMGNIRFSLVAKFLLTFLQQYEGDLVLKNAKKYNPETKVFDAAQETIVLGQEKKFTYFIVSKQPSLEKGFNIAPFASVLNEDMDVVILRDVTADSLMSASIQAFQGGSHVDLNEVEYFKTTDLCLRVKHKAEICLDGEIHDLPANGIIQLKTLGSSTDKFSFTVFS